MSRAYTPETLPRTLTVRVTAEDIASPIGNAPRCAVCPLALALNRAYPIMGGWWVEADAALDDRCPNVTYPLSSRAFVFVSQIDAGLFPAPATFRLRRAV